MRKHALFHAGEKNGGKLQPLGGMKCHERDYSTVILTFRDFIGVGN